ncbi:PREDICTED: major royal jelly protein 3-like [Wasmannia auropunctata]|uniref:major royal jelly protein 3-like n=1 Tax=Wasmannia auropunctata TaxID=64793 RepID=UPI0005EFC97C|nr:PREDICTED: major royal jelly protein 3-like [Wasmannia auropunctata]XP_011685576.1 PREDICTED: major royal jelly protein 3-like [Wasmannia auropunctata]XP_011685577.1 PREDICTED: major royal jelly protein 3-like [Wasmannia auropunctata]
MEHFLFALLILSMTIVSIGIGIDVKQQWKYAEYDWDSKQQMDNAVKAGIYKIRDTLLYDVDKAEDGRVFVTVPNYLGPGSPASLTTITNKKAVGGPRVHPYPDWDWHNGKSNSCDVIVNVARIHIKCNHLFVMDNGKIGTNQLCVPKLLIFDLSNDKLVKTISIPFNIAFNETGLGILITPVVYVPGECTRLLNEMTIFVTEPQGYGLVVYDSSTKRMCRVESDYMKSTNNNFNIAGEHFIYDGGIFSLAIAGDDLYYAALTGNEIYKIKIKTLLECPNKEKSNDQSKLVTKLQSQAPSLAAAGQRILFYSDFEGTSILGMNLNKSGNNTVVLAQDNKKLQVISGMKYIPSSDQLIFLSNRVQRHILNTVNVDEINYRYFEMDGQEIRKKLNL